MRSILLVVLAVVLCCPPAALAQDGLAFLIPTIYGPDGLFVDSEALLPSGATHSAHFNSDFQSEFTQFNIALGSQLAALPIPSPASGFTYTFDSSLGVFTRSTESFGPILADRAETIGKGKYSFGINYQYFSFDEIEGLNLDAIPAVFTHDGAAPGGRADVVTTVNSIDTTVSQVVAFLSYGISDRLDFSIAVPLVSTDLSVKSVATVQRLGTSSNPAVHFFGEGFGDQRTFSRAGSASGVGDIILRLKGTAKKTEKAGTALGIDVRLPTGDEEDLLGTGAEGVKPFLVFSFSGKKVHPHINLAYQWNGDSVLAGNVLTGEEGDLPDSFLYSLGFDVGLSDRATLAFDILGQQVIDSPQLKQTTFTGLDAAGTTFSNIKFDKDVSFDVTNAALGFKFAPNDKLLVDLNVLVSLDDGGMRDDLTPLIGIEYAF